MEKEEFQNLKKIYESKDWIYRLNFLPYKWWSYKEWIFSRKLKSFLKSERFNDSLKELYLDVVKEELNCDSVLKPKN